MHAISHPPLSFDADALVKNTNYKTPNYLTSSSLLLWSKYPQQVTAQSTKVTALYTNICDKVEIPFQVSVSSSGSKP
jgi:hypothetical protein